MDPTGEGTGLGWPTKEPPRGNQSDGPHAADSDRAVDSDVIADSNTGLGWSPGLGWPTADGGLQPLPESDQPEEGGLR